MRLGLSDLTASAAFAARNTLLGLSSSEQHVESPVALKAREAAEELIKVRETSQQMWDDVNAKKDVVCGGAANQSLPIPKLDFSKLSNSN